jgi:hypothetical protein
MKSNMKKLNKKSSSFFILSIFVYIMVLLASLDIFTYYFTRYLGGVSFYTVLSICILMVFWNLINLKISKLRCKQIFFFSIWAIIYAVENQVFVSYKYSNIMGINFNLVTLQTMQVICVFIMYTFFDSVKVKYEIIKVNIIKIILLSIVINAIVTLRALEIDPNIARIMATGIAELNTYDLKGISGYSLIYSLVIIIPLLYSSLRYYNKKNKLRVMLLFSLIVFLVYKAAYTTALIALMLGFFIYLFLNTSNMVRVFLLPLILLMCIFLMNPNLIYDSLMYLSYKIEIQQTSIRLQQLADLILYGDSSGDTLNRLGLYRLSIDAFLKYPLTGIIIFDPNYNLSGHSAFLDILGATGLVGFIPYLLFIWYSYRISLQKTKDKKLRNGIRTSYFMFCFIGSINTLATSFTIMLFLLFFVNWYPAFVDYIKVKQNISKLVS